MAAINTDIPTAFTNAAPNGQTPQSSQQFMSLGAGGVDSQAVFATPPNQVVTQLQLGESGVDRPAGFVSPPNQSWVAMVLSLTTPTVPDPLPPVVSTSTPTGVSTLNQGLN